MVNIFPTLAPLCPRNLFSLRNELSHLDPTIKYLSTACVHTFYYVCLPFTKQLREFENTDSVHDWIFCKIKNKKHYCDSG